MRRIDGRPGSVGKEGGGVLKALLLIPAAALALLILAIAFYEGRKAYWDYRVREMCARDGGTRVLQRVLLDRHDAVSRGLLVNGTLIIPARADPQSPVGYYLDYESLNLRASSPRIFRARTTLVRASDRAVLAEMVTYSRVGGDFPTFAHPSSITCSNADSALIEFRSALQVNGAAK